MSRHSKNNTAGSVFTYHEKLKMGLGSGSSKMRLAGDSIKQVDSFFLLSSSYFFFFLFFPPPFFFLLPFLIYPLSSGLVGFASLLLLDLSPVKRGICFVKNVFVNHS